MQNNREGLPVKQIKDVFLKTAALYDSRGVSLLVMLV